jgi:hypothetical protein
VVFLPQQVWARVWAKLERWGMKHVARAPSYGTGRYRRILSEGYFTDHFGKMRESSKIVVFASARWARLTEK